MMQIHYCLNGCEHELTGHQNKAVDLNRIIIMESLTPKDYKAINIGLKCGVQHFALSFCESKDVIQNLRSKIGKDKYIIAKIESPSGLYHLNEIIDVSNAILVDRGDLSRQVSIEKIPFYQKQIISSSNSKGRKVYVATNLLETMVVQRTPSRAELNDVVSTLLMGADGLVLAAETAIGKYPVGAVNMIRTLIEECEKWTEKTSLSDIMSY